MVDGQQGQAGCTREKTKRQVSAKEQRHSPSDTGTQRGFTIDHSVEG